VKTSKVLRFSTDVSVSVPFCKCILRALYALTKSNRSAPPSSSMARNSMFCTTEPTGRYRLECSSGSLAYEPCTFGARGGSGGGRRWSGPLLVLPP
jgi:hypothetical protein